MLCSNQLCIENDSSSVEFDLFLAQNRLHSLSTSTCVSVRAQSSHNSIPFPPSTLAYSHHQPPPRTQLTWTARQKPDIELVRSQVATVSLCLPFPPFSLSLSHILLLFISFCFALSLSSSHCLLCKAVNTLTNIFRAMQCTKYLCRVATQRCHPELPLPLSLSLSLFPTLLTLKLGDVLLPLLVTSQRYHRPAAAAAAQAQATSDVVVAMPHPVAARLCATAGDAAAWPPKCMQTQFSTAQQ